MDALGERPDIPAFSSEFLRRYEILGVLGEGGMSTVYLARQASLQREVAIKVLKQLAVSEATRFLREGKLLSMLDHPNILKVLDAGLDGSIPYLVCEMIRGETAADRLTRSGLPLGEALEILQSVSKALAYAHSRNIVHRDVKPSNIFLCEDGGAKLADFGLARNLSRGNTLTGANVIVGTPEYMSPEQVRGERLTPKSDQYSLGVTGYVLISRNLPFKEEGPMPIARARLNREPIPLCSVASGLPQDMNDVIMRTLALEPGRRYPTVTALLFALRRVSRSLGDRADLVFSGGHASTDKTGRPPGEGDVEPAARELESGTVRVTKRSKALTEQIRATPRLWSPLSQSSVVRLILLLLTASACLAVAWVGFESPSTIAPDPRASAHSPSRSPLVFRRPTFPGHRRVALGIEGPLSPSCRFELRSASVTLSVGLPDPSLKRIVFEDVPPGMSCQAVILDPSLRVIARSHVLRTPSLAPLRSVACIPGSTGVLVDFEPFAKTPLSIEVGPWGESRTRIQARYSGQEKYFRRVLSGLRPETKYCLRIRSKDGWGGLDDYPFTTEKQGKSPLHKLLFSVSEIHLTISLDPGWQDRNLDTLEDLIRIVKDPKIVPMFRRDSLVAMARYFQSFELVDALFRADRGPNDPVLLSALLEACTAARHPGGLSLARQHLQTQNEELLLRCARGLAQTGTAEACDELALRAEHWSGEIPEDYLQAMVDCHRNRSRLHFKRWLSTRRAEGATQRAAITGMALLADPDDIALLLAKLKSETGRASAEVTAGALARIETAPVRRALVDELRSNLRSGVTLWANAYAGNREVAGLFEKLMDPHEAGSLARDGALALSTLGKLGNPTGLRRCLDSASSEVVQAACWALATLGDADSGPAILKIASRGSDPQGVAAYCAGLLKPPGALATLEKLLQERKRSRSDEEITALAFTALGIGRLGDRAGQNLVKELERAPSLHPLVRDCIRASTRLKLLEKGSTEYILPPMVPVLRTGIRLFPGDWVDITASGWWGGPGAALVPVSSKCTIPATKSELLLTAFVGRQKVDVDQSGVPLRLVASCEGELIFSPYRRRVLEARSLPLTRMTGLARIILSR